MNKRHFDVIWIGSGQATFTVVPRLAAAGKSVAIIEGGSFGGTCVNHGCTPTKMLVASARAVHLARRGAEFGFTIDSLEVDFPKAMQAQQTNRQKSSSGIESALDDFGQVFKGYAEFLNKTTIVVNGQHLTGDTIVVHTGTRPAVPDVHGAADVQWLTNETLLDLTELPEHLVIVGGSYVALEFAQIFRRLGSEVTVLQRGDRLVPREDDDICDAVAQVLSDEGVRVICNVELQELSQPDGVAVQFRVEGALQTVTGSHLLFATGRVPNSDRINATAAELAISSRGHIEVNGHMQSSVPGIFALGDVNGRGAFTHTSANDGEIFWDYYARQNDLSNDSPEFDRTADQRNTIYSMFIDPPMARVGMSEKEARASGRNVLMAVAPMSRIARAREKRETNGLVKILVDADSEEILGATVFGTGGDEVIGVFAVFMQTGQSWKKFRRIVFPHPTVSELMPWILDGMKPLEA